MSRINDKLKVQHSNICPKQKLLWGFQPGEAILDSFLFSNLNPPAFSLSNHLEDHL